MVSANSKGVLRSVVTEWVSGLIHDPDYVFYTEWSYLQYTNRNVLRGTACRRRLVLVLVLLLALAILYLFHNGRSNSCITYLGFICLMYDTHLLKKVKVFAQFILPILKGFWPTFHSPTRKRLEMEKQEPEGIGQDVGNIVSHEGYIFSKIEHSHEHPKKYIFSKSFSWNCRNIHKRHMLVKLVFSAGPK